MDQYGFKLISYLTAKCQISWAIGVFKLIIDGQWITIGDIRAAAANLQFVRTLLVQEVCSERQVYKYFGDRRLIT
jgi:hypothetical protein